MLAARELLTKVFDAAGLAVRNEVQQSVLDLARAQDVRVHQDKIKIEDPVDVLKDVSATPLDREVACLDSVVTLLETDLGDHAGARQCLGARGCRCAAQASRTPMTARPASPRSPPPSACAPSSRAPRTTG